MIDIQDQGPTQRQFYVVIVWAPGEQITIISTKQMINQMKKKNKRKNIYIYIKARGEKQNIKKKNKNYMKE